ncbi:unnamed protein product [Schistosoma margrebowiei]|uniref:Uncharacterized protein n=1 Tax=Schistosoma margrebowiei TaxID=48269 RepID=A0A183N681_9TREM|nr:unnamed protein product [Schistosoma margrebowiei]
MKTSTSEGKHGIQWISLMQLYDLDFADDLAILSKTQQQMQEKTNSVAAASAAGESDADVKARIGKARAAYLQLRNILNSKQMSTNTKVRIFNINVKTVLLSVGQTSHYQQQPTVGENKPDPSGGRNQEEALEVDRTHIEESTQRRRKTSPHMESSRPKEKWKTKEHITSRNGNRHEKD